MATSGAAVTEGGDLACDIVVLGAGPGGYSAAFRAADLGMRVVLVERHSTLGGVCLNVGCIPSKALLHVAALLDEAARFEDLGVHFGAPSVDLVRLRAHKASVVEKLTTGLAGMAATRRVTVLQGSGRFVGPTQLRVEEPGGGRPGAHRTVRFERAIIAAGSRALSLASLPDDPRIIGASRALELPGVPRRMLLVGGGIIGLELGTVYSSLGARLDVVEIQNDLMPGADRDLVRVWRTFNAHRFDRVMLETQVVETQQDSEGVRVYFEGKDAPTEAQTYDLVLRAAGRAPNGDQIGAERAGITLGAHGFIAVDGQMRTNVPQIFAVGDIAGPPMLAHKAVHEGHVAAEVAAGELLGDDKLSRSAFDARVVPSVAYTDPEIGWVGITEARAEIEGRALGKSVFPWRASGRAVATGRSEGLTKLLFDPESRRIVGGGIVGTHAGDLIGEIALAIEMGADVVDIGNTIHPHPTLGESIAMAAEAARGTCTDLPPPHSGRR